MCDAGIIYCKCEMIYKFLECAGSLRVHDVHPRRFEHSLEASYRSRGHVSECAKVGAMHRTATASIGISKVIQGGSRDGGQLVLEESAGRQIVVRAVAC